MILVTGGAGYIGSLLVRELLSLGERVRVVDTLWYGHTFEPNDQLDLIEGDILQFDQTWLNGVDAVIHLAGLSNDPTADFAPELNNRVNVQATRLLAEAVAEKAIRDGREMRFLFASSCSVYYTSTEKSEIHVTPMTEDMPITPTANYSKTKRLAEIMLLRLADQYPLFCPVILRKGTIFGLAPRMRFDLVLNTFTLHAHARRELTINGSGEVWRPLLSIRDAVDAYLYLLIAPSDQVRGEIFNVVHKNYRIMELAYWVAEVLKEHRQVEIQVKRNRNVPNATRSYYVVGDKITRVLGFQAERGTTEAILAIWDALESGSFGQEPEKSPAFFNIRSLTEAFAAGTIK